MFRTFSLTFLVFAVVCTITAQVDSGIKPFAQPNVDVYINDTNGDGRFVVFESTGNLATFNPRNSDGNTEIFLLDVAQRHVFQITDTKHALANPNGSPTENPNILVAIFNTRPSISNDGKWIAFGSNATTSVSTSTVNGTNPGNFNGNTSGHLQILQQDGNIELWLYQIPTFTPVDLSAGDLPPFVDLGSGTHIQATNTIASQLPRAGTTLNPPYVSSDNGDACLNDDGATTAFSSTRDLVSGGNSFPGEDNEEIFVYKRLSNTISQISRTPRGPIASPIYNQYPTISGNGLRVAFASTGTNPIIGMIGGSNPEFNEEVYFSDLTSSGSPTGTRRQVTQVAPVFFEPVNFFGFNRRMSRDGQHIVFDSTGDLANENGGTIYNSLATYHYDVETMVFRRIGPRSDADQGIPDGDPTFRYPLFTDYPSNSTTPGSIIISTRLNFRADGSVPPTGSPDGLNPSASRPSQVFSYNFSAMTPLLKRISISAPMEPMRSARCFSANSSTRITCTLFNGQHLGGYYFLIPSITQEDSNAVLQFFTGASARPVGSGSPEGLGLAPNMLGYLTYSSSLTPSVSGFASGVSNSRNFVAPIQLKGVSVIIDGVSASVTGVSQGKINFVVPPGLSAGIKPVVVINNGIALRGSVLIINSPQPDVLNTQTLNGVFPGPAGRAYFLNVTDPNNPTTEPFRITTQTPNGTLPTKLRIYLTGVEGASAEAINIRIGNVTIPSTSILTNAVATDYPGVFSFEFTLPQQLDGVGNVPVVVSINGAQSQEGATAPRVNIIANQSIPSDLAVWRPSTGVWWVLGGQGSTQTAYGWGASGDIPVPGDFDGDGKTDFSIFRPTTGAWWISYSSNGGSVVVQFGAACSPPNNCDIVVPADYDGDRKTDVAVWRPSDRMWYIIRSSDQGVSYVTFGLSTDVPKPADFDGDGKADLAVWRESTQTFYSMSSSDSSLQTSSFAITTPAVPVPADYDGDGRADIAFWQPSNGNWIVRQSSNGQTLPPFHYGQNGDIPVHNDYDGDGKCDKAVFRPAQFATWWIWQSTTSTNRLESWGTTGDIPVPALYRR